MQEKRQGYKSILLAYDSALALKDVYTGGHGHRVARYSRLIAEALGLPDAEVDAVSEAALLHDLGKIGIPDNILTKPDHLTLGEYAEVQKHSAAGAEILHSIPPLRHHAMAVRHHHERFDGSGYPDGLRGQNIPFAARIIAVADAFDALSSNRSYPQKKRLYTRIHPVPLRLPGVSDATLMRIPAKLDSDSAPRCCKNRRKLRSAVIINWTYRRRTCRARSRMNRFISLRHRTSARHSSCPKR